MTRRRGSGAPLVVAIGGFDPSCGAGVVADARSIDAMGCLPLAVVTSITVQSGSGVRSFRALAVAEVLAQLDELLARLPVAALKIGQVPTPALARALAQRLAKSRLPLVLDPVLRASGGGDLAARGAAAAIAGRLLPLCRVVTVNLDEAGVLTGGRVETPQAMREAARALRAAGARAVLVKGGHLGGEPSDLLVDGEKEAWLRARRIAGSMHGTGCALASALAARLALGDDLLPATNAARAHVRRLLGSAQRSGRASLRAPRTR